MSAKRVLVTGASGFVGANLVRRLVADGHEVHAITRPGTSAWRLEGLADDLRRLRIDLRDAARVHESLATVRPEWIFHLAAYGGYSWQTDRARIVGTNFVSTVELLDAATAVGFEAFLHAGSSSEYGFKGHAPSEDELPEPNSDYAATKAAATLFCGYVGRREDVRALTLRLYSVYGPWEEPRRLIPRLVAHGLRGTLPPLVDATVARDFVYVDDVVEAFVLAAVRRAAEPGSVYNVGTGKQTSIAELVALARRTLAIQAEPRWSSMPDRAWDTDTWVADSRKIRCELGWEPRHDLEDGFRRTAQWIEATEALAARYGLGAA